MLNKNTKIGVCLVENSISPLKNSANKHIDVLIRHRVYRNISTISIQYEIRSLCYAVSIRNTINK